jgi:kinesin family member 23
LEVDLALVYSLGGDFPSLEFGTPRAEELLQQLKNHLELRLQRRANLLRDKAVRGFTTILLYYLRSFKGCFFSDANFRSKLDEYIKGNMLTNNEVVAVRAQLQQERQRSRALESKLVKAEDLMQELRRRLDDVEQDRDVLQKEVRIRWSTS